VAERRVPEYPATLQLTGEEARHVVSHSVEKRRRVGLEGLHDDAPRAVTTAPPRELRDELEGSLLGPEVREPQPGVSVDHGRETHAGYVVALRHDLRADQDVDFVVGDGFDRELDLARA
jgi:hypothetical protein